MLAQVAITRWLPLQGRKDTGRLGWALGVKPDSDPKPRWLPLQGREDASRLGWALSLYLTQNQGGCYFKGVKKHSDWIGKVLVQLQPTLPAEPRKGGGDHAPRTGSGEGRVKVRATPPVPPLVHGPQLGRNSSKCALLR